jgi:hypothetical protein
LLINLERVGDLGCRADDVLLLKDCDTGVRKLAEACGWLEELEALWGETEREQDKAAKKAATTAEVDTRTREEKLEDEVDKLTKEVEQTLKISQGHTDFLNAQLGRKQDQIERKAEEDEVATTEVYHTSTQPSPPKPLDDLFRARFANKIDSYITSQINSIADSSSSPAAIFAQRVSPISFSPGILAVKDDVRSPDAQWAYFAPDAGPSDPCAILLVGSLDSDAFTAHEEATLKYFTKSRDLQTVLTVDVENRPGLDSKRAAIKMWERTTPDAVDQSSEKAKCVLRKDFRLPTGEMVDGQVSIPLAKFAPASVETETGVRGVDLLVPFAKLVEWLEETEKMSAEES